jgi:hypothetical protein
MFIKETHFHSVLMNTFATRDNIERNALQETRALISRGTEYHLHIDAMERKGFNTHASKSLYVALTEQVA